jgi:hypothetical protein
MTTLINRAGVKITVETDQNVTITEKQIIIDLVKTLPTTSFDLDKKKKTNKTRSKYMTKAFAKRILATPAGYSKTLVKKAKVKLV